MHLTAFVCNFPGVPPGEKTSIPGKYFYLFYHAIKFIPLSHCYPSSMYILLIHNFYFPVALISISLYSGKWRAHSGVKPYKEDFHFIKESGQGEMRTWVRIFNYVKDTAKAFLLRKKSRGFVAWMSTPLATRFQSQVAIAQIWILKGGLDLIYCKRAWCG